VASIKHKGKLTSRVAGARMQCKQAVFVPTALITCSSALLVMEGRDPWGHRAGGTIRLAEKPWWKVQFADLLSEKNTIRSSCSFEFIQRYFSAMEQYFLLTIF
jgi:hypothetical protein